jgi:ABC-type sulfate/molybdate transport systems ATPase subunit
MLKVEIKSFAYEKELILKDIRFQLDRGQHMAVLGESGCGKSTLLHIIYGLLHLENGTISWDGTELLGPNFNIVPGESFIKLVAQEYNVMPFTTVAENVAEHLSRLDPVADKKRVRELLEVVDMIPFTDTMVKHLSGGQKQRVALSKALAKEPKLLLLDEPFSHIDTFRKNSLRRKLFSYLKENNISCITATHDAEEALAFSDTLLILKNGTTEVIGSPEEIYNSVSSVYQAGFFDEVNILPPELFSGDNGSKELLLFPHQLKITSEKTALEVTVVKNYFKGGAYLVEGAWQDQRVFFNNSEKINPGKKICLVRNHLFL